MSPFLNGVRVFDVLAPRSNASLFKVRDSPSTDDESSSRSEQPTPAASPKPKHHSDGDGIDGVAIPIVAIVFTFIWLIVKAVMAPFHQKNRIAGQSSAAGGGLTQEEVAVLQKIQRTLSQMESRVEALETILIEQARTEKNYGSKL